MRRFLTRAGRWICIVAVALLASRTARGDDAADVKEQLRLLQQQNQRLEEQLNKQQQLIESLTGRVDVFCSIHSTMHCVILVLENRYFASPDARNRFTIPGVPAGTYKLKAWHERLPATVKEVSVPENGEVNVDFTLGVTGLPQY